jgi:hypothetical protein
MTMNRTWVHFGLKCLGQTKILNFCWPCLDMKKIFVIHRLETDRKIVIGAQELDS